MAKVFIAGVLVVKGKDWLEIAKKWATQGFSHKEFAEFASPFVNEQARAVPVMTKLAAKGYDLAGTDFADPITNKEFGAIASTWSRVYARKVAVETAAGNARAIEDFVNDAVNNQMPAHVMAERAKALYGLDQRGANQVRGFLARKEKRGTTVIDMTNDLLSRRGAMIGDIIGIAAINFGKQLMYMDAIDRGLMDEGERKVWVTALDERVCPTCGPMDGISIPMTKAFSVTMPKPKTARGSRRETVELLVPPVHPNCRCTVVTETRFKGGIITRTARYKSEGPDKKAELLSMVEDLIVGKAFWDETDHKRDGKGMFARVASSAKDAFFFNPAENPEHKARLEAAYEKAPVKTTVQGVAAATALTAGPVAATYGAALAVPAMFFFPMGVTKGMYKADQLAVRAAYLLKTSPGVAGKVKAVETMPVSPFKSSTKMKENLDWLQDRVTMDRIGVPGNPTSGFEWDLADRDKSIVGQAYIKHANRLNDAYKGTNPGIHPVKEVFDAESVMGVFSHRYHGSPLTNPVIRQMQNSADKVFDLKAETGHFRIAATRVIEADKYAKSNFGGKGMDPYVKIQNDLTQEALEGLGVESMPLARGMNIKRSQAEAMGLKPLTELPTDQTPWRVTEMNLQPLNSFTANPETAIGYATGITPGSGNIVVLTRGEIPRERIFSAWFTGPGGGGSTAEVVVKGGKHKLESIAVDLDAIRKSLSPQKLDEIKDTYIKGRPGRYTGTNDSEAILDYLWNLGPGGIVSKGLPFAETRVRRDSGGRFSRSSGIKRDAQGRYELPKERINEDVLRWLTDEHQKGQVGSGLAYIRENYGHARKKTALGRLYDKRGSANPVPVYRGGTMTKTPKAGQTISFDLASFTSDPKVAHKFANARGKQSGNMPTVIRVLPGMKTLDLEPYYNVRTDTFLTHRRKKEVIGAGKVRVVAVYTSRGTQVVEVKPVSPRQSK